MPKRLIVQFNSYMELREKLAKVNELFIQFEGCELLVKTDYVTYWLKRLSGRQDVTGIIKYAIVQMMTNNINQLAIEKFTKVGDKIIKACKEQYLKDQGISLHVDLDSKIRRSKIFEIL
ncbi:hypothetical protein ACFQ5D_01770 [Paenibacillus farraposensis]|uniref:Uncharacterized protein n=2 Tax=Paenibacillus farraposensis TaxID=2807095 RepID=A0ABW4DAP7_9BACL|nr:hypothetical protein [Paenibacillus farraposensis]MCC3381445.1 hypothetical protein [Paenibacillus farraposensis]